jgi:pilin isopeptide linkage protein
VKIQLKNLYEDPVGTYQTYNSNTRQWVGDTSHLSDGKVVLKLTTSMTDSAKLKASTTKFVNHAYIYEKFDFANGTGKQYILLDWDRVNTEGEGQATATVSLLKKSGQYDKNTYPYIKYTLTVNSTNTDIVDKADTITIVDTMSDVCRLASAAQLAISFPQTETTTTPVPFEVKDADGNVLTEGVDYTLEDNTQSGDSHSFTLTVPDATALTVTYYVAISGIEGTAPKLTNSARFDYKGYTDKDGAGSSYSQERELISAAAGVKYNSEFMLQKTDQNNKPLDGATFAIYKVELNDDGTIQTENGLPKLEAVTYNGEAVVMTTGADKNYASGTIWFDDAYLTDDDLYCVIETQAPEGYEENNTRYYVQFTAHNKAQTEIEAISGDYRYESVLHGGTIQNIVNQIKNASATVTIQKAITLNGASFTNSTAPFTFTLVPSEDNPATTYLDENCATELTSAGTTVTINGAGSKNLGLYFTQAGTYTYTVTENDLTQEVAAAGYTKDDSSYTVTVNVTLNSNGTMTATVTQGQTVTFTNTYTPEVTLKGTKVLTGNRAQGVKADEFTFSVYENGQKVASGTTLADGEIQFDPITFTEAGTHTYTIMEDTGSVDGINYNPSHSMYFVYVTVKDDLSVTVTYPKAVVFTNEYEASGSLTLSGKKTVTKRTDGVAANEFSFSVTKDGVYETTINTKAGGDLELTLDYDQMDIGQTYVYQITENEGTDSTITYSDEVYTLTVTVADGANSDGKLAITATLTNKDGDTVALDELDFVNVGTYIPKAGISLDVLPYGIVAALALGTGAVMIRRKRHSKA